MDAGWAQSSGTGTVNLAAPQSLAPASVEEGQPQQHVPWTAAQHDAPPSTADWGTASQDSFAQQVMGQMARSATQHGLGLLKKGAGEIRIYVEKNHYSVHVLSLCGGAALASVSLLGLLNIFAPLSGPLSYFLHFYQLTFGLVLCVIDGPSEQLPQAKAAIVQYAPLLHNNAGRSFFYLFIACLEGSQDSWTHMLVGWYFAAIAVMHIALKFRSFTSGQPQLDEKQQELLT
mmetsp:Transcript_3144/g.8064  ORF Transcript_3144/g.8064 Transcript_3144/m.8064 type:complete len:231 (+) Transcript_3144:125-817(+)